MIGHHVKSYNNGIACAKNDLALGQHPQTMRQTKGWSKAFVSGYNITMRKALGIDTKSIFITGWDSYVTYNYQKAKESKAQK